MSGITINVNPIIFQVGALSVRWYSLFIIVAILAATWMATKEARRVGLDEGKIGTLAVWAIVVGFIGARLFHVLDRFDYYASNPAEILAIHKGGLAIWGGLASGAVAGLVYAKVKGLPIARTVDVAAVSMLAGQIIGRLGCIVNGDAYGGPTSLPWGFIYVNAGAMIPDALKGIPTHPYPVYEMLWDGALLLGLWLWRKRARPDGMLFLTYAAVYALGRFTLTFVRQEREVLFGLQQAQVIAVALMAVAVPWMVWLWRRAAVAPAAVPAPTGSAKRAIGRARKGQRHRA
ncbi:MAG: prolipoprotein diacylglyceryl transferase [Chloroflexota bacterium]|nr:prolipoprotein diacylglyceryl transferase [Chloroflexota bacterium]